MSELLIQSTLDQINRTGLKIALTPERGLKVIPASKISPELRNLIRKSKVPLVDYLRQKDDSDTSSEAASDAHRITSALIKAAMRRCDVFGDGEAAREEMRQQCMELPARLQIDLLLHFQGMQLC